MAQVTQNQDKDHYTLLSRLQAAKYLGVSKGTLAMWAMNKKNLPYVKVGRLAHYRLSDLKTFIDKKACDIDDQTNLA